MKCTNKFWVNILSCLLCLFFLVGCAGQKYEIPYDTSSFSNVGSTGGSDALSGDFFATNLCVVSGNGDVKGNGKFSLDRATAAGLFDVNNNEVKYAENVHTRLDPASLTKVLTALIAIKNSNPDDLVVASINACSIKEKGAQLLGLEPGDSMTMAQALHALLMYSANDVAIAIAETVGGTNEEFADMMNEEANRLGATNCHFVNPNGLTDENHYVTAYDLYLIFNEAIKYDLFTEIISCDSYTANYQTKSGGTKEMKFGTTNLFLKGTYKSPGNITVIGGKTGTTTAARNCLILLSKDEKGNPFISVILKAEERGILYDDMTALLSTIS